MEYRDLYKTVKEFPKNVTLKKTSNKLFYYYTLGFIDADRKRKTKNYCTMKTLILGFLLFDSGFWQNALNRKRKYSLNEMEPVIVELFSIHNHSPYNNFNFSSSTFHRIHKDSMSMIHCK